uniref:Beta-lactamase domain protein n=1 Tax=Solibacter usitatus (strain Ellin6076) TaxID=234267 RepID=Q02AY2_SOLUE
MNEVRLTVHRATHQIGGNCVEISTEDGHRIILDVGRPLDAPQSARGLLPKSLDIGSPIDGVLISHPHQDHYGVLEDVPADWPIYPGEPTARLIKLTSAVLGKQLLHTFQPWKSGVPFQVGPFAVTPLLTDHSAFDAHMLLIEVHGKRILYSGDFRTHGRKSVLPRRLMKSPPKNLDILLMEGTNLGSDKSCVTESDLENDFVELFRGTAGRVFVAWSAQNVDRTVTLYRACLKTGRTLIVDLYTAEVMEALAEFGKLPRPSWNNLKVVITKAFGKVYRETGRADFVDRVAPYGIAAARLAETPSRWVAMVRSSLIRDYVANDVQPNSDDAWCWSMWQGYLKNEEGARVQAWFEEGGSRAAQIHTSGHASPSQLRTFAQAMNAEQLIPIHGDAWDENTDSFPSIRRLADGEPMTLL